MLSPRKLGVETATADWDSSKIGTLSVPKSVPYSTWAVVHVPFLTNCISIRYILFLSCSTRGLRILINGEPGGSWRTREVHGAARPAPETQDQAQTKATQDSQDCRAGFFYSGEETALHHLHRQLGGGSVNVDDRPKSCSWNSARRTSGEIQSQPWMMMKGGASFIIWLAFRSPSVSILTHPMHLGSAFSSTILAEDTDAIEQKPPQQR